MSKGRSKGLPGPKNRRIKMLKSKNGEIYRGQLGLSKALREITMISCRDKVKTSNFPGKEKTQKNEVRPF